MHCAMTGAAWHCAARQADTMQGPSASPRLPSQPYMADTYRTSRASCGGCAVSAASEAAQMAAFAAAVPVRPLLPVPLPWGLPPARQLPPSAAGRRGSA